MNWDNLLDYVVQPSDMGLFQRYAIDYAKQHLNAARTPGILSGGTISIVSGMQLQVSAGVVQMPSGQLASFPQLNVTLPTGDSSNPRVDRVELSVTATNNTSVVDVNSTAKFLDIVFQPSLVVLPGTPNASPVAPLATSVNISLGLISVSAAQSALILGNINQAVDTAFITSAIQLGDKNAFIRYNRTSSLLQFSNDGVRWQSFGSGGGGGGGGANWQPVDGLSPVIQVEYGDRAFLFSQGEAQAVSLFLKVPSSYLPGSPLKLKLNHYSPSTTGYFKFQATSTLIRKDLDAVYSTTNQFLSTNGDVANSVANLNREVTYNLSGTTGLIGSVSPNPGDTILVQIQRVTPAGTDDLADVRMIPSSTETLFS
jgi:hypothetical protein